jgi:5'-3' exoribonuclease 2
MAIDGVVPRAKMMGQRANRFLKSKNIADGLKEKFLTNDQHQAVPTETFDECNIKPGTKFMSKLSERLQNHICHMVNTEDTWHSLKIILSDANVPGEGEHKIINFIRQQRDQRDYVPNKYHFIYCSDSDLVLLGLLRHECNFTIICEECDTCKNIGHSAKDCDTIKNCQKNKSSLTTTDTMETKYVFIDVSKLSNLLKDELEKKDSLTFPRKSECSIDDWVLICLLFGNDFLPKSPSINFFGNSITMNDLIDVYRKHVEETRGYLTTNGTINMNRLLTFLKKVGQKDQVGRFSSQQYYRVKFEAKKTPLEVVTNYVQGLCWVFQYYYQGPPSWNWYAFYTDLHI